MTSAPSSAAYGSPQTEVDVAEMLRIGEVAKAVGVSIDTLRRWDAEGRVRFVRRGNQRMLPASELGKLLQSTASPARASSARNRLSGVVVAVERDGVMAKVELACGDFRVVSLMSREAADDLQLEPGVHATAIIKSTNVIVDR
jgi:molybdopterin-binding protein